MTNDAFISYSKTDKATADAICEALEAQHLTCWYAPRNIPSGADWDASIMEALANSRVMILVWSSQSDQSKQVKREVAIALDDVGITLIPFRVEEIVSSRLRYYLGNIQWLDASAGSFENSLQRLVDQVIAAVPQGIHPTVSIEKPLVSRGEESTESKQEAALESAAEEARVRAAADVLAQEGHVEEAELQRLQEEQNNSDEIERRRVISESVRREESEAQQQQVAKESKAKFSTPLTHAAIMVAIALLALGAAYVYLMADRSVKTGTEVTTPSGLKYTDLVVGSGPSPTTGQTLSVHYTGTLQNGTKFDSSHDRGAPMQYRFGLDPMIKGWDEGVSTMKVGGKRKLIVPPDLGYGPRGKSPDIPGNSTLLFDLELVGIK